MRFPSLLVIKGCKWHAIRWVRISTLTCIYSRFNNGFLAFQTSSSTFSFLQPLVMNKRSKQYKLSGLVLRNYRIDATHLTICGTCVKQNIKKSAVCKLSQATYAAQRDGLKSSAEKKKSLFWIYNEQFSWLHVVHRT